MGYDFWRSGGRGIHGHARGPMGILSGAIALGGASSAVEAWTQFGGWAWCISQGLVNRVPVGNDSIGEERTMAIFSTRKGRFLAGFLFGCFVFVPVMWVIQGPPPSIVGFLAVMVAVGIGAGILWVRKPPSILNGQPPTK